MKKIIITITVIISAIMSINAQSHINHNQATPSKSTAKESCGISHVAKVSKNSCSTGTHIDHSNSGSKIHSEQEKNTMHEHSDDNISSLSSTGVVKNNTLVISVQGKCDMCKARIENAAMEITGVSFANWEVKTKKLHLNFDSAQTSIEAISKAVAKAGHDTDRDKADNKTYNALPGCCKYKS